MLTHEQQESEGPLSSSHVLKLSCSPKMTLVYLCCVSGIPAVNGRESQAIRAENLRKKSLFFLFNFEDFLKLNLHHKLKTKQSKRQ